MRNFLVLLCFFGCHVLVTAQCAMCRAVLESEESQSMAKGINDGIVFLMAIPYLLVGIIGFIVYYKFFRTSKHKSVSS